MKSSRQGHAHAPIRVAECEMITAQATAVSHPVVAQPVVLPPVLPPVLGKSRISRNSEVPGLPGCHSEGEENRRSEGACRAEPVRSRNLGSASRSRGWQPKGKQ